MRSQEKIQRKLKVSLLGQFMASISNKRLPLELRGAKQILAWLILKDDHCETRERLAGVIWPDKDEDRARGNLRQSLFHLRKAVESVGFSGLQTSRSSVKLEPGSFATDIDELLDALQHPEQIPAVLLQPQTITEKLLDEFSGVNDLYTDWIQLKRLDLDSRIQGKLNEIIEHDRRDDLRLQAGNALLLQDPGNESACRTVMSLHERLGNASDAIRVYTNLHAFLRDELDVKPAEQTQKLALEIKHKDRSVEATQFDTNSKLDSQLKLGIRPTVEISRFDTAALQPAMQPVVGALRAELMSRLSKFREWQVVDGSGERQNRKLPHYRVTGVALQIQDITQITLSLFNCGTGEVVWSNTFRDISLNWSTILVEIASQVSATANISISRQRLLEISGQESSSVEGFDAWLVGQQLLFTINSENWERAEDLLQKVIAKEPNFTRAYTCLARIHNTRHLAFPGKNRQQWEFSEALRLSNAAIACDPLDCQAHLCRAWSLVMLGNYTDGAAEFEMARNLNPYDPWTTLSCALGAAFGDQFELAIELAERSLNMGWTIQPVHWAYHGTIRFLCGDYAGCVSACQQAGDVFYNIAAWHAAALMQLNRTADATLQINHLVARCQRDWSKESSPAPEQIIDWVVDSFPIKNPQTKNCFVSSVKRALMETSTAQLQCSLVP